MKTSVNDVKGNDKSHLKDLEMEEKMHITYTYTIQEEQIRMIYFE